MIPGGSCRGTIGDVLLLGYPFIPASIRCARKFPILCTDDDHRSGWIEVMISAATSAE